jgi:hypothetical protein
MTTKKDGSVELSYESVWNALSAIDCSDKVDKKNGLSYLSWAWAWGIMMEHYPQTHYDFLTEERDDAHTCTVWCKITINDLERMMWLPVMDYKNKAIVNPDARAISDTRMRCLTKCLAMYGLGHYIYAGEDLPVQSEPVVEEKSEPKKPPAKKAPPKKADNVTPISGMPNTIGDAEEASKVVDFICQTADTFATGTEQELISFWSDNKKVIDLLDSDYPEHFTQLKAHFGALRQSLKNKESNDE